jgi:hypothetical protein
MKLFSLGFVVLSKVKKTSASFGKKKKKSSKQETKIKVSALLFFSHL